MRFLVWGGASTTAHGRDMSARLRAAIRDRGLEVVLADNAANMRANIDGLSDVADIVTVDVEDTVASAAWAASVRESFAGVLAYREYCTHPASLVAKKLGLKQNSPQTVALVRDKHACRTRLAAAGLRQPRGVLCTTMSQVRRAWEDLSAPLIVKPNSGSGSQGVTEASGLADLLESAGALFEEFGSALLEEVVVGREYSAEGVFADGAPKVIALTEKKVSTGRYFVEEGHLLPARLTEAESAAAVEVVTAALRECQVTCGPFHVEFWLTDRGDVVLGEVHVRPGGDWLHLALDTLLDQPFFELVLGDLLGHTTSFTVRGAVSIEFVNGVGATGPDRWRALQSRQGCLHARALQDGPTGSDVPKSSADREGVVVMSGATPAEALARTNRAVELLKGTREP